MKKKDNTIVYLALLLLAVVGFVSYYYMTQKDEVTEEEEEVFTISDKELQNFYNKIKFDYSEELVFTASDLEKKDNILIQKEMSSNYAIYLGMRNPDEDKIGLDTNYNEAKPQIDKEGYKYTGKYIKSVYVKENAERILGPILKFNNVNIKTLHNKYTYNAKNDVYYIWEREYESPITKVSYAEYAYDEKNIYITEYVAYTKENNGYKESYTRHNPLLAIAITEKNKTENLDLMDAYKYTFTLNENVNKYFLSKIEYVK